MGKVFKTSFALFFASVTCFAGEDDPQPGFVPGNSQPSSESATQIPASPPCLRRTPQAVKKPAWAPFKKRKLNIRPSTVPQRYHPNIQDLISETQFMCVCPNAHEFLAALRSFSSLDNTESEFFSPSDASDEDEPLFSEILSSPNSLDKGKTPPSFIVPVSISPDELKILVNILYARQLEEWRIAIESTDPTLTGNIPYPICFLRNGKKQILCLAWCGQGFEAAAAFCEKSKIFENLKHVLIGGICACPSEDVEIGSVFYSRQYIKLPHCTLGDCSSARSKRKKIYYQGSSCYFTEPKIFPYENRASFFNALTSHMGSLGITINPATNFSIDCFVDDQALANDINAKTDPRTPPIIDMEGAIVADFFLNKCLTVFSLRTVSDHAGASTRDHQVGKVEALNKLKEILKPATDFWMNFFLKEDMSLESLTPREISIGAPEMIARPEVVVASPTFQ